MCVSSVPATHKSAYILQLYSHSFPSLRSVPHTTLAFCPLDCQTCITPTTQTHRTYPPIVEPSPSIRLGKTPSLRPSRATNPGEARLTIPACACCPPKCCSSPYMLPRSRHQLSPSSQQKHNICLLSPIATQTTTLDLLLTRSIVRDFFLVRDLVREYHSQQTS